MLKDVQSLEEINRVLKSYYDKEQVGTKAKIIKAFESVMEKVNIVCGVSSDNEINDDEIIDEDIRKLQNKYIDDNLSLSSYISRILFEAIEDISAACGIPISVIYEAILWQGLEKYGILYEKDGTRSL